MKMYAERRLSSVFDEKMESLQKRIKNEDDNYILTVGEDQYISYLISEYQIDKPVIHFDNVSLSTKEKQIHASRLPVRGMMFRGSNKMVDVNAFIYHIPLSGEIEYLRYTPRTWNSLVGADFDVSISRSELKIEVLALNDDKDQIKRDYEQQLKSATACYDHLVNDIEKWNNDIKSGIRNLFNQRKHKILKIMNMAGSLGVPLKKDSSTPKTFSVPKPKTRPKILIKPTINTRQISYIPEPSLNTNQYLDVLKVINDVGKNFERLPSVYKGKSENDLRDHMLMVLDPNFSNGTASGETFNFTGKTDIQLRHDSSVVFVAECKFWKGQSSLLSTIDQLLSYLTWRDSKTAIIFYVKNKNMSTVIQKVSESIDKHSNYIGVSSINSNFNIYTFHLNGDANREIHISILLYHLPD